MAITPSELVAARKAIHECLKEMLDAHPEWEGKLASTAHDGMTIVGICFCEFADE